MIRQTVDSSVIKSVGYNAETCVLEIQFLSGRIYLYFEVPRETYAEILAAPSVGNYFNHNIRNDFRFEEL